MAGAVPGKTISSLTHPAHCIRLSVDAICDALALQHRAKKLVRKLAQSFHPIRSKTKINRAFFRALRRLQDLIGSLELSARLVIRQDD